MIVAALEYSANDPEYDRNLFDSADSGFSSDDSYGNRKAYECSNYYKLIRSNSLRSALKQPTPVVRTKSVRFADNVGLNLVEHSFYQAQDHADDFAHSNSYHSESVCAKRINAPKIAKYNGMQLVKQNFNNRTDTEIMRLIQNRRVILDSVKFVGMSITGVIDVLNLSPYKQVYVRFSLDGWHSSTDAQAKYVKSFDNSGAVDVFHFVISFSFDSPIDAKCEFCVLYVADNQSYWDNNCSQNFVVNLVAVKDNKIGLPPKCTTVIKRETTANNVSANKALPSRKKYDERRQEIRASEFAAKDFNLIDRKITKISTESDYLPVLPEEEGMRHPIGRRWKCSASYLLSTGSI